MPSKPQRILYVKNLLDDDTVISGGNGPDIGNSDFRFGMVFTDCALFPGGENVPGGGGGKGMKVVTKPSDLEELYSMAKLEAKKYFKKAIEINPNYYEAIVNYANSCVKTNDRNEAKENFDKALAINPKEPYIYLNYGTYFQEANRHEEALKYYNKC